MCFAITHTNYSALIFHYIKLLVHPLKILFYYVTTVALLRDNSVTYSSSTLKSVLLTCSNIKAGVRD